MDATRLAQVARVRAMCRTGMVREIRAGANISQWELADALNRDPATISRWECGARLPSPEDALRLASILDLLGRVVPDRTGVAA